MSDSIKVAIKVRPLIKREKDENQTIQWAVQGDTTIVATDADMKKRGDSRFQFGTSHISIKNLYMYCPIIYRDLYLFDCGPNLATLIFFLIFYILYHLEIVVNFLFSFSIYFNYIVRKSKLLFHFVHLICSFRTSRTSCKYLLSTVFCPLCIAHCCIFHLHNLI